MEIFECRLINFNHYVMGQGIQSGTVSFHIMGFSDKVRVTKSPGIAVTKISDTCEEIIIVNDIYFQYNLTVVYISVPDVFY